MITDKDIAQSFNEMIGLKYDVKLVGGGDEPRYLPSAEGSISKIIYTQNYIRSALHELAHWALAGQARRALDDYGYWYESPPRPRAQQEKFFSAELRVQALEKIYCDILGVRFSVSSDNVGTDCSEFSNRVANLAYVWSRNGLSGFSEEIWLLLQIMSKRG
tara:strand:- start:539 stop:1021 length:483 start_codon:yes stop_codon:yes gene_type:complete